MWREPGEPAHRSLAVLLPQLVQGGALVPADGVTPTAASRTSKQAVVLRIVEGSHAAVNVEPGQQL